MHAARKRRYTIFTSLLDWPGSRPGLFFSASTSRATGWCGKALPPERVSWPDAPVTISTTGMPARPGLLAALAVAFAVFASPARADCGFPGVRILGSAEEAEVACAALDSVLSWFAGNDQPFTPTVTIRFLDRVFCDFPAQPSGLPACTVQVSGLFDFDRGVIEITSADSPYRATRHPWGIDWGPEIAFSVLQHEMVHMAVAHILGPDRSHLSVAWHELVAYAVQFDLMDPHLRARILERYADATPFRHPDNVNAVIYGIDPDLFGVRAWLYVMANGNAAGLMSILRGAPEQTLGRADFFWTP